MVRAPCCEKMGLKKGPWTPDEDRILICFIQKYGHENWRALPKQAGLLRCGKSCRLRWMNYLRPDIKRGNFTEEEEETIIKLHEMLGNRWSAIAATLPGRTDNEIKNVWHTHLKKKLKHYQEPNPKTITQKRTKNKPEPENSNSSANQSRGYDGSFSSQPSVSDVSSTVTDAAKRFTSREGHYSSDYYKTGIKSEEHTDVYPTEDMCPEIDESFWSDALSEYHHQDSSSTTLVASNFPAIRTDYLQQGFPVGYDNCIEIIDDGMEFWYDLFVRTGGEQELPQF